MMFFLFALSDDDKAAIEKLFSEHHIKMYNLSFGILHSKEDAEEALQQAFLNIINHYEKIQHLPCPELVPYCVVIVKNLSLSILRRSKKVIYVEDMSDYADSAVSSVEDDCMKEFDKEKLLDALDRLSADEKSLIRLRWSNEMSFREIGELFGISEETAKKRGQRAIKKLHSFYEKGEMNEVLL